VALNDVKKNDIVTIQTSEFPERAGDVGTHGIVKYVADGLIGVDLENGTSFEFLPNELDRADGFFWIDTLPVVKSGRVLEALPNGTVIVSPDDDKDVRVKVRGDWLVPDLEPGVTYTKSTVGVAEELGFGIVHLPEYAA
jgi:translation initiation factor IF-1